MIGLGRKTSSDRAIHFKLLVYGILNRLQNRSGGGIVKVDQRPFCAVLQLDRFIDADNEITDIVDGNRFVVLFRGIGCVL